MADYPIKSRVAFLEVGDIFSFFESGYPRFVVNHETEEKIFYSSIGKGMCAESVSRHSQRIILILDKVIPKQKYRYKNTETGDMYKTLPEVCNDIGFTPNTISKYMRGKRNRKIPIEKIRPY